MLRRFARFLCLLATAFAFALASSTPAIAQESAAPADGPSAAVAGATEAIRAEPSVHLRDAPWAVPVRELELELQPLPPDKIQERVEIWLYEILQTKVRERTRAVIALDRAGDDGALAEQLAAEEQRLQSIINAIIERTQIGVDMLNRRGIDVTAYQAYINDVAGVKINLGDPKVLYKQTLAWVRSPEGGLSVVINIVVFALILVAFAFISKLSGAAMRGAVKRINKDASQMLINVLGGIVARTVMLIGLVVAVSQLGVDITPLLAAIGAAGLVIGLALQGTLSNFASGILILINKPYDVGDVINAGGVTGVVDAMNLVSTKIKTFDNQVMYVPNNAIWGDVITNVTGLPTRRVDLVFGIAYSDDMAKAERILIDCLTNHPLTLDDPAPAIKVHELGDNSVNFIARPWVKTGDYWAVYWDLMRQVKERFDAEGVNIPFPQRDLHLPDGAIRVIMEQNG